MKLNKILKASFSASESDLKDDTRLMGFPEWDSMSHMFFITKLEEAYDIVLTGDEIASMDTVGKIREIILSRGKEV